MFEIVALSIDSKFCIAVTKCRICDCHRLISGWGDCYCERFYFCLFSIKKEASLRKRKKTQKMERRSEEEEALV